MREGGGKDTLYSTMGFNPKTSKASLCGALLFLQCLNDSKDRSLGVYISPCLNRLWRRYSSSVSASVRGVVPVATSVAAAVDLPPDGLPGVLLV